MKLNQAVFAIVATFAATATVATGSARRAFAQGSDTAIPPAPSETQMGNVPAPPAPETTPPVVEPAPAQAAPAPAQAAPAQAEPAQAEPGQFEAEPVAPTPGAPAPVAGPPYPDRQSDILLPQPYTRWRPRSGMGLALMVGGGVTDFTGGTTRNETSTGGAWTARLAIATRSIVGFDASYVGGANTLSGLGTGSTTLVRNGLEGAVRINAPLYSFDTLFEPYAIVGVGWNAYRLANVSGNTASVSATTDNTVSIPMGLGFALGYRGFMADIRYTYRPTYDQSIFVNQSSGALTNWDLGGMVGYEF
jgi:hypothetical protein